jgi:AbiU2
MRYEPMTRVANSVKELQNALIVAELNYEIWWVYKEKESRRRYVDVLNSYPLFFQTSLHAHFVAMIVSLYRIYETRKDTINLPQLIALLKAEQALSPADAQRVESEMDQIKDLWIKVSVLRNKMFGHRSNAMDLDGIWKQAAVTPNQFKQLIDESKRILNEVTSLWDNSGHAFNLSAREDTVALLENLRSLRGKL